MSAQRCGQQLVRSEALLGVLQLLRRDKSIDSLSEMILHVEKDVRQVGSRKLKAKYMAVKGIISENENVSMDNRYFHQSLSTISACGLKVLEKQLLDLLLGLYKGKGTARSIQEYHRIYAHLMDTGSSDLHLVRPRGEIADLLPVSLAV